MSDHPELRASAAQAQEIDDLTSTVRALDARIAELKAALRGILNAYDDPTPLSAPREEQEALSARIDAAWARARRALSPGARISYLELHPPP